MKFSIILTVLTICLHGCKAVTTNEVKQEIQKLEKSIEGQLVNISNSFLQFDIEIEESEKQHLKEANKTIQEYVKKIQSQLNDLRQQAKVDGKNPRDCSILSTEHQRIISYARTVILDVNICLLREISTVTDEIYGVTSVLDDFNNIPMDLDLERKECGDDEACLEGIECEIKSLNKSVTKFLQKYDNTYLGYLNATLGEALDDCVQNFVKEFQEDEDKFVDFIKTCYDNLQPGN